MPHGCRWSKRQRCLRRFHRGANVFDRAHRPAGETIPTAAQRHRSTAIQLARVRRWQGHRHPAIRPKIDYALRRRRRRINYKTRFPPKNPRRPTDTAPTWCSTWLARSLSANPLPAPPTVVSRRSFSAWRQSRAERRSDVARLTVISFRHRRVEARRKRPSSRHCATRLAALSRQPGTRCRTSTPNSRCRSSFRRTK